MNKRELPDGWRWVKFGEVVRPVKDRVDPETSGLDRYVAGEHMDTDDLRVRRWGTVGEGYLGPAFHMRFKPGQVLYGSRRTYLRKVAVADFEGICANTTFVVEPASRDLVPEFLPFVMTTDAFHEHSIKQSKGSVNPYINFKDLEWYEFPLPPRVVQQQMAEELEHARAFVDLANGAVVAVRTLRSALVEDAVWDKTRGDWSVELVAVAKLLTEPPRNGVSPRGASAGEENAQTLSISAVQDGRLIVDRTTIKWCEPIGEPERFEIRAGDVFAVRGNGNRSLVGRVGLNTTTPETACLYPDLLIRLRFDDSKIDPVLATAIWNSQRVHGRLIDRAKSSNGIYKVNGKDIANHRLPVPGSDEQSVLVKQLSSVDSAASAAEQHAVASARMMAQLREALLGGAA